MLLFTHMKQKNSATDFFVVVIVGGLGLVFLSYKLIGSGDISSLQGFIDSSVSSSTLEMATSSDAFSGLSDALAALSGVATSSSDLLAPSADFSASSLPKMLVKTSTTSISVLLADNEITRERGLSGFTSLGDTEGMLFQFPSPTSAGFWMKDTYIPLDMVWINENKEVIGVSGRVLPSTYPAVFYPPSPITYALEINAGMAEKFGIKIGTKLQFETSGN